VRFLLDTNVISELRKGDRADPGVRDWFAAVTGAELALSVLVLGELHLGLLRLRRRDPVAAQRLQTWLARVRRAYRRRTLPVDAEVVTTWARLNLARPLPVIDSLQAATADVHGLTFVTRNVADLDGVDVALLNPFSR
jgi:predicted nucleic acid-binding protein